MKYTTSLVAALSGVALLSTLPTQLYAAQGLETTAVGDQETLEDLMPDLKKPELWIGSSAPELSIAKFVKGDSVDHFEEGQVYVVEFWATWCGPCIAAFPHLSEMQEHFGEDVHIIGVNVSEQVQGEERMKLVEKFVDKQGDRMRYTVAVEDGRSMGQNWLRAAQQSGIPAAFIVDGNGKIAWIGHPQYGMEDTLKEVVSGDYDTESAAGEAWDQQVVTMAYRAAVNSYRTGEELDTARKIANLLIDDHFESEPSGLNAVAWMQLNAQADGVGMKDYQSGLRAAAKACNITEWKDWGVLDTYALAMYKTGDKVSAIKWEKKAIELAKLDEENGGMKAVPELEEQLARFEAED